MSELQMTLRDKLRDMIRERQHYPRGSAEWEWRTRTARKWGLIIQKVPTNKWKEMEC